MPDVSVSAPTPPAPGSTLSGLSSLGSGGVPPLPTPGNLTNQLAQGQQFFNQAQNAMQSMQAGDPAAAMSLVNAGITLAAGQTTGTTGMMVRALVQIGTATASGAAVGGPFGAAAGAVVGAVESVLQSIFGSSAPTFEGLTIVSSPGSQRLYKLVYQWGQINGGAASGAPQGQTFAEFLKSAHPPDVTRRPNLLAYLAGTTSTGGSVGSEGGPSSGGAGPEWADVPDPGYGPYWPPTPTDETNAQAYLALVSGVDTSILWGWAQPAPGGLSSAANLASAYAPESQVTDTSLWESDTPALSGAHGSLTKAQIMASALARRPDPLYFATDLYVQPWQSADGSQTGISIVNTETASALATILGMLAVGASTRAIVAELMLQQNTLSLMNQTPGGTPAPPSWTDYSQGETFEPPGSPWPAWTEEVAQLSYALEVYAYKNPQGAVIPPLFRCLVEDYVALAQAEAKSPHATMDSVLAALGDRPATGALQFFSIYPDDVTAPGETSSASPTATSSHATTPSGGALGSLESGLAAIFGMSAPTTPVSAPQVSDAKEAVQAWVSWYLGGMHGTPPTGS
jgi:hypothetical protein